MESIESTRRLAALESKVCDPQSTRNLKYLVRKTQGVVIYLGVPAHYPNPTQNLNTKSEHKNPTQNLSTKIQHKI